MTATREQRRRKREREIAARDAVRASGVPTQREADRAARARMRADMLRAEATIGRLPLLGLMWGRS